MQALAVVAVLVVVALVAYWSWRQEKQRQQALAALADELGWEFDPAADTSHDEEYAHFEIFRRGHGRRAHNTLRGAVVVAGQRCGAKLGDFLYKVTTHNGKTTQTHTYRFSYLIVHLPYGALPDLLIRPEGLFDKLAGAFGFDDIDFESEEFSRRFHVKGPDKRFAYDVVHPRMMELLLAEQPPAIDIENGRCCLSDGKRRWSPEEIRTSLGFLERFFAHWPEHVLRDLRSV